jgi:hypothetical protein
MHSSDLLYDLPMARPFQPRELHNMPSMVKFCEMEYIPLEQGNWTWTTYSTLTTFRTVSEAFSDTTYLSTGTDTFTEATQLIPAYTHRVRGLPVSAASTATSAVPMLAPAGSIPTSAPGTK